MGSHFYKFFVIILLLCVHRLAVSVTTETPTETPSFSPTKRPTKQPSSKAPSATPSHLPTSMPTGKPTSYPTSLPTSLPTSVPSSVPTSKPTSAPSPRPSSTPTSPPSSIPTSRPTAAPTNKPTPVPTYAPTFVPSAVPSFTPSACPSLSPTYEPSAEPTAIPSVAPSTVPTFTPSGTPTAEPTPAPTIVPSASPSCAPTFKPTTVPSFDPTAVPSFKPTAVPSFKPTAVPSIKPTAVPSIKPTAVPSFKPTAVPSARPSFEPTDVPSATPSFIPTAVPTCVPTAAPSTAYPSPLPTTHTPTVVPTIAPNVYNVILFDVLQLFDNISYNAYLDSASAQLSLNLAVASSISGISTEQVTQTEIGLITPRTKDRLFTETTEDNDTTHLKNSKLMELVSSEETISVTYEIEISPQKMGYNNDSDAFEAISEELTNAVLSGQFDDYWHNFASLLGVGDIVSTARTSFFQIKTDSYSVVDTQPTSRPTSAPSVLKPTPSPSNKKNRDDDSGFKPYEDWNIAFQILFPLVLILAFIFFCYVWSHTDCASWCYRGLCHPPDTNQRQYSTESDKTTSTNTNARKEMMDNMHPSPEKGGRKGNDSDTDEDDDIEAHKARSEAWAGGASPTPTKDKYTSPEPSATNIPIIPRTFLREALANNPTRTESSSRRSPSHRANHQSIDKGTEEDGIQLRKSKSKSRPAARGNDTFTSPSVKGAFNSASNRGNDTADSMTRAAAAAAFIERGDDFLSQQKASGHSNNTNKPPPPPPSPEYVVHDKNNKGGTTSPHSKTVAFDPSLPSPQRSSSQNSHRAAAAAAQLAPKSIIASSPSPATIPSFRKPRQVSDEVPRSSETNSGSRATPVSSSSSRSSSGGGSANAGAIKKKSETPPKARKEASKRNLQSVARQDEKAGRDVQFTGATRRSSQVRAAISAVIAQNRLKQYPLRSPDKAKAEESSARSPNSASSKSSRNKARLAMRGVTEEAAAEAESNKPRLFSYSTSNRIPEADMISL